MALISTEVVFFLVLNRDVRLVPLLGMDGQFA
jgi:hypothetical protein